MSELVGFIEHRLKLKQDSSEFVSSKKRKRTEEICSESNASIGNAGLFFVPFGTPVTKEYLLVVPHSLLKAVCDAARYHQKVKVSHFTVLDLGCQRSPSYPEVSLMELGKIQPLNRVSEPQSQMAAMILTDLREIQSISHRTTTITQSIVGIVDSISPIIAVLPTDPFCLIEMYQLSDCSDALGCVLVVKGETALSCHIGIMPGDTIKVESGPCQRWNVPKALQSRGFDQMHVPNRVIVITDPKSIFWQKEQEGAQTVQSSLAMVQGYVAATKFKDGHLRCIELVDKGDIYKIFTNNLPMSINLQYGMRQGALVRAINIHTLLKAQSTTYFGSCLRSTIAIIKPASARISFLPFSKRYDANVTSQCLIPWHFNRIRSHGFQRALSAYLRDKIDASNHQGFSRQDFVRALLMLYSDNDGNESLFGDLFARCEHLAVTRNRRDQFSEFFDHGMEGKLGNEPNRCGCHMSFSRGASMRPPSILGISELKQRLLKVMEVRLNEWVEHLGSVKIPAGSIASIQLRGDDIARVIDGSMDCLVFITGKISAIRKTDLVFCLSDAICSCPITVDQSFLLKECSPDHNVVLKPKMCVVSAMCLGMSPSSQVSEMWPLERWTKEKSMAKEGSCSMLELNGYIFIVSIHVHSHRIVSAIPETSGTLSMLEHPRMCTVEKMLNPECDSSHGDFFTGLLCHQRLKFNRVKSGCFEGIVLVLAHSACTQTYQLDARKLSTLQTLKLDVSIELQNENCKTYLQSIKRLMSRSRWSLLEEQYSLAIAWWKMSDGPLSPLIACGVDETLRSEQEINAASVVRFIPQVIVPTSSYSLTNHGYVRFKCDMIDIQVRLVELTKLDLTRNRSFIPNLTSLGNLRQSQGMLGRPLVSDCSFFRDCGIQTVTIGDLHQSLCAELRQGIQTSLAPSLVRLVRKARFLAVSYCKVQVECSSCYSNLIRNLNGDSSQQAGATTDYQGRTFWDYSSGFNGAPRSNTLKCPNHCPIELAHVIWECRGLLDDGTGQCHLFAEGRAVAALLELDQDAMSTIESGAWETASGICFQKNLPISSFLMHAIQDGKVRASNRNTGREVTAKEVIPYLTPKARALYVLHRVCSKGAGTFQEQDFLVRCKPRPRNGDSLNLTEVRTTNSELISADSVVYALPPLKVTLVHNCRCS